MKWVSQKGLFGGALDVRKPFKKGIIISTFSSVLHRKHLEFQLIRS